jgi:hypothetical protein
MLNVDLATGNDAFAENLAGESARILREIADRIEGGGWSGLFQSVLDSNGNVIGTFRLKPCTCSSPCEHIR